MKVAPNDGQRHDLRLACSSRDLEGVPAPSVFFWADAECCALRTCTAELRCEARYCADRPALLQVDQSLDGFPLAEVIRERIDMSVVPDEFVVLAKPVLE